MISERKKIKNKRLKCVSSEIPSKWNSCAQEIIIDVQVGNDDQIVSDTLFFGMHVGYEDGKKIYLWPFVFQNGDFSYQNDKECPADMYAESNIMSKQIKEGETFSVTTKYFSEEVFEEVIFKIEDAK
jgi:hypothetical protein